MRAHQRFANARLTRAAVTLAAVAALAIAATSGALAQDASGAPKDPFRDWLAFVRAKIAYVSVLPPHVPGTSPRVVVRFTIGRDGRVTDRGIAQPSGCDSCDKAALSALAKAGAFPPIPAEANRDHVDITVPIVFRLPPKGHHLPKGPTQNPGPAEGHS